MPPLPVPATVALSSSIAFASTAAAWTFVAHPGGLEAGPAAYTAWFNKMFPKIAKFQSVLVLASAGGALAQSVASPAASQQQRLLWLLSGSLMLGVLPWTFGAIMPLNKAIMAAAEKGEAAKEETLKAWGPVHNVRTVAGLVAAAVMGYALWKL
ncbi:hypothetical protein Agub_g15260 [Astrephomene gubernaculifera]|uniref:DUF1772-domain-containing protein n=1 Tax=Astrephomene gubernaculifera TaxID=47775 RepID=A0AAD3E6Q2_9CHLO|nr:hypothetical protein Agub_g15260 [Astrephomene gubernaculifera]